MTTHATIKILLVEDDLADQKLIKNSLQNQNVANELYVVSSSKLVDVNLERKVKKLF